MPGTKVSPIGGQVPTTEIKKKKKEKNLKEAVYESFLLPLR
jgi:hypothetical protein